MTGPELIRATVALFFANCLIGAPTAQAAVAAVLIATPVPAGAGAAPGVIRVQAIDPSNPGDVPSGPPALEEPVVVEPAPPAPPQTGGPLIDPSLDPVAPEPEAPSAVAPAPEAPDGNAPEQDGRGVQEPGAPDAAAAPASDILDVAPLTAVELLSLPASVEATAVQRTLKSLRDIEKTCRSGAVAADYVVDCVARSLHRAAAALPGRGELLYARRALLAAAHELDQIVSGALDPARGKIAVPLGGAALAPRLEDLRAVRPERLAEAQSAARDIMQEVQLVLLRSSDDFERHTASFQQIAMAVDSSKNLLRSS